TTWWSIPIPSPAVRCRARREKSPANASRRTEVLPGDAGTSASAAPSRRFGPSSTLHVGAPMPRVFVFAFAALAAGLLAAADGRAQGVLQLPSAPPPRAPQPGAAAFPGPPPASGPAAAGLAVTGSEAFEVVPLKYADVSEIVGLLTANQSIRPNDSFTPEEPAFGSSGLQGGYYGAGGITASGAGSAFSAATVSPSSDPVGRAIDDSIGIDRRLNAIVLKGTPERIARLKAQIEKLDVPVATSVVLDTVFVELTESGARNLGIDFNNANGQIGYAAYTLAQGDLPGVANTAANGGRVVSLQAAIY